MVIKDDLSRVFCCSPSAGEYLSPHGNCHLCDVTCLQCTGPEREDCTSCATSWWCTNTCTPNTHAEQRSGLWAWNSDASWWADIRKPFSCLHTLLLPPAGYSMMADVATSVGGGVLQTGTSAPSVTTPVRTAPTKGPITAPAVTQVFAQPPGKSPNVHLHSHLGRS